MAAYMREHGKIIKFMEKGLSEWLMAHTIKEAGEMIANMGKELTSCKMEPSIEDHTIKEASKAKEYLKYLVGVYMKVNLCRIL